MMNISSASSSSVKRPRFEPKSLQNKELESRHFENRNLTKTPTPQVKNEILTKQPVQNSRAMIRILTGDSLQALKWFNALKPLKLFCYYEVIAPIVNMSDGNLKHQRLLLLRGAKGPVFKVVYYLRDMVNLSNVSMGDTIRCVGRMMDDNKMQSISVRKATEDEISHLPRLFYVSNKEVLRLLAEKNNSD